MVDGTVSESEGVNVEKVRTATKWNMNDTAMIMLDGTLSKNFLP